MTYLITGATGFIGRRLVATLLAQGHAVKYLARKRDTTIDSRVAFFPWNTSEEAPLDCTGRLDAIIHLAGEPVAQRWTPEIKDRIRLSRVEGTRNIVTAIGKLKHRPSVLVSASAIGYYGDGGERILTEDSPHGSDFLSRVCVEWEREAARAQSFGLRVVSPRISIVLGPDGGALRKMISPFRFGLGGTLGNGKQWMAWIHVEDMVRLLHFAAETTSLSGPVNAASPNPVTNAQFTRELAAAVHRPAIFHIPIAALKLGMGEMAGSIMNSLRVVPQVVQAHGFTFLYPALPAALRACVSREKPPPAEIAQGATTARH